MMPVVFVIIALFVLTMGRMPQLGSLYCVLMFFQITALFSEILVKWPLTMPFLFTIFSITNLNQDLFGFECSMPFEARFGLTIVHPLIFLLLFGLIYVVTKSSKHLSTRAFYVPRAGQAETGGSRAALLKKHFVSSYVVLILLSFVYQFRAFIDTVDCTRGEGGAYFMDSHPPVHCGSNTWIGLFIPALGALVLYIVLPTVAILVYFMRLRAGSSNAIRHATLGFLTHRFRSKYYYWEAVNIFYKLCMVAAVKFLSLRPLAAILLTASLAFVMMVLQLVARPYRCSPDNNLAAFLFGFQTILCMIMLVFHFSTFSRQANDIVVVIAVILTVVAIVAGLAVTVYQVNTLKAMHSKDALKAKRRSDKAGSKANSKDQPATREPTKGNHAELKSDTETTAPQPSSKKMAPPPPLPPLNKK